MLMLWNNYWGMFGVCPLNYGHTWEVASRNLEKLESQWAIALRGNSLASLVLSKLPHEMTDAPKSRTNNVVN